MGKLKLCLLAVEQIIRSVNVCSFWSNDSPRSKGSNRSICNMVSELICVLVQWERPITVKVIHRVKVKGHLKNLSVSLTEGQGYSKVTVTAISMSRFS